jgi:hypothetical protein
VSLLKQIARARNLNAFICRGQCRTAIQQWLGLLFLCDRCHTEPGALAPSMKGGTVLLHAFAILLCFISKQRKHILLPSNGCLWERKLSPNGLNATPHCPDTPRKYPGPVCCTNSCHGHPTKQSPALCVVNASLATSTSTSPPLEHHALKVITKN